jgi:hypothetical protein
VGLPLRLAQALGTRSTSPDEKAQTMNERTQATSNTQILNERTQPQATQYQHTKDISVVVD